eukprot:gene15073-20386_t
MVNMEDRSRSMSHSNFHGEMYKVPSPLRNSLSLRLRGGFQDSAGSKEITDAALKAVLRLLSTCCIGIYSSKLRQLQRPEVL